MPSLEAERDAPGPGKGSSTAGAVGSVGVSKGDGASSSSLHLLLAAPSLCSSGRSHSFSCHSSFLPEPLQIKAWVQNTNPCAIMAHTNCLGMEKAWSPEANPLHPFYLGHCPKPPLDCLCLSITPQETPPVSMEELPCVPEASLGPELPGLVGQSRKVKHRKMTQNDDTAMALCCSPQGWGCYHGDASCRASAEPIGAPGTAQDAQGQPGMPRARPGLALPLPALLPPGWVPGGAGLHSRTFLLPPCQAGRFRERFPYAAVPA